jgi:transcriptional regulator with XRE-family HTH domain
MTMDNFNKPQPKLNPKEDSINMLERIEKDRKAFSELLRKTRQNILVKNGKVESRPKLSARLGISAINIANWEDGKSFPEDDDTIWTISQGYGIREDILREALEISRRARDEETKFRHL